MLSPKIETDRLILRRYKEELECIKKWVITLKAVSDYLLKERNYYLVECTCNELNTQSAKVMKKAGFIKDGYIKNRRINDDGLYSRVEYYSKCLNNKIGDD